MCAELLFAYTKQSTGGLNWFNLSTYPNTLQGKKNNKG